MSGICGLVFRDRSRPVDRTDLHPMVRALDFSGCADGFTVTTGHAGMGAQRSPGRLAGIAELSLQDQALVIAFHGSLYNMKELFPPNPQGTDHCRDLLQLFVNHGMPFLRTLRGEFSLALWDGRDDTLYLATDRFRVHPLFYYRDPEKIVFASRMKSLTACPFPMARTINPLAIVDLVASSIIPTPKTVFREVHKLPPGHILTSHNGEIALAPYWETSFPDFDRVDESELARTLKVRMDDAISVQLAVEQDYDRVGTFLSGGVDSSTVTGLVARQTNRCIKSFSIGFDEQRFNEMNYARIAARAFGVEHHEYFVTPQDTYNAIPVLLDAVDEPFANASIVPAYFCANMARECGATVLYAGDGGDELFAGNERYATQWLFQYYHNIPTGLREHVVTPLVVSLADRVPCGLITKAKKYVQRASLPYHKRISSYDFFNVIPISDFLDDDLLHAAGEDYDPYGLVSYYYSHAPAKTDLDRHLYIDWNLTLSDNDLIKVTKATECAGVNVRFPFLDLPLVEFSTTVPARIKMRGGRLRSFFKGAYADMLPLEILEKKKHGFGLPIPIWLNTDKALNELMHELVLGPGILQRRYFRKDALKHLVAAHSTDHTSFYGTVLWNLMMLELWLRKYGV